MKLVVLGDSIAVGTYTGENDRCPMSKAKPFGEILKEKAGFTEFENCAVNGITYSKALGRNPDFSVIEQEKHAGECDMLLISAGTNDYGINVKFGDESDADDVSFCGAVEVVFNAIANKRKNTRVVIVTPYTRYDGDVNKEGVSLSAFRTVLANKAKKYGFTVVDGDKIPLKNERLRDNLHPDQEGHEIIADYIARSIIK